MPTYVSITIIPDHMGRTYIERKWGDTQQITCTLSVSIPGTIWPTKRRDRLLVYLVNPFFYWV